MKKIIAIVVVIVALLMGAFFYWIHQPALVGEEQVTQSVNDANKRFAQTQREAKSAELNGFLSEEFLPVWSGQEGEVKQTLTTWSAYSNALRGNEVNHSALLDDANYRAARDGYEAVLPSLLTELDKRLFVVPRESLSSSQAPDANGLRTLSHSVYAYVESKVAEGKPEEAVRPLAALFSLGGKMQGRETLGNDLAGIAIQRIAFQAVALIPSDSKLAAQDWLSLATAVNQGIPPKDQMARAFEAEVSVSLEQIQKNENEAAASGSSLDQLFLQREKRIFMNQTAEQIQALKSDGLASYAAPEQSGTIAQIRTSDFVRAGHLMEAHRRAMVLAATALDLRAYRAKNGKLPQSLDQLVEMGLETPEESMKYDPEQGTLSLSMPAEVLQGLNRKDFDLAGWSEISQDSLIIHL